jgi:hypothetical protein
LPDRGESGQANAADGTGLPPPHSTTRWLWTWEFGLLPRPGSRGLGVGRKLGRNFSPPLLYRFHFFDCTRITCTQEVRYGLEVPKCLGSCSQVADMRKFSLFLKK